MLGRTVLGVAVLAAVTSGCSASSSASAIGADGSPRLRVVASFYPLQYVAQRVGGDAVVVASLTKPGVEPHDLELSPRDVASVGDADAVLFVRGFQPAVDRAVDSEAAERAFDAHDPARLTLTYTPIEGGRSRTGTMDVPDPHFWLDPLRLADVADAFAARLATVEPARAGRFTANAATLRRDLAALDADFTAGLASCTSRDLVTSHNAFGYLAQRYGLHQVGIGGLDPEQEPASGDLADVAAYVRSRHVRTIYSEILVSPRIAGTVAQETGARTAVLDPIEGITSESAGTDYLQVMRADLATLRVGQPCP